MRPRHPAFAIPLLCLVLLAPAAHAIAAPGDPIVLGGDIEGTPGLFFEAIHRVLPGGTFEQLSAGNAMPSATAFTFTGPDSIVAVRGESVNRFTLSSKEMVSLTAPEAIEMKGVALAPDGSVVVADAGASNGETADGRVLTLDPATGETTTISSGEHLVNPLGIVVGEDGTIYVTDSDGAGDGSVIEVDPTTGAQHVLAASPFVAPWGIAFLPNGELVVADESYNHAFRGALVRIDPTTGAQTPLLLEHLNGPIEGATGVAVDPAGEVLVTERSMEQVDRVNLQTGVAQQIVDELPSPIDVEIEPGTAPTTRLLSGPSGTTRDTTPTFTFEPSIYGSDSTCEIDAEGPVPCRRAFTSGTLASGAHTFTVSSASFGTQGPAAVREFTVDPTALDTQIDSGPSGPTNDPTPSFTFEAPGGGTSFTCSIDGEVAAACASPFTVSPALADGEHTFTVRANNDPVGDSRTFTVDTTPPTTSITSGPGEGAATNATQPTFTFGSSEEPSTFECTLDAVTVACGAVFSPAAPLAEGAHTLTVAAVDAAGNADPQPLARHFTVDTTPPVTTITAGPSGTITEAAPTFEFTASEPGVTFHCSLDAGPEALCTSPFTVSPALADGNHVFHVRATDLAGNAEVSPPEREFTVDTVDPDTSIIAGPNGPTSEAEPSFEFTSTKPGSTFACSLDGAVAAPCTSPFATGPLADGPHTFAVTATDTLGHEDPTPATRAFTVDTVAPHTVLGAGPGPLTNDRTPQFEFSSEPGATFACSLDGGAATVCTSPFTAPPLADGPHTLSVAATDLAGNTETTPPEFAFTVDTTPPVTTIEAGPVGTIGGTTPSFEFSASEAGSIFACSLDGGAATACTSPFTAPVLADGAHVFRVRATDPAGNVETVAASREFTVDTVPPTTTIDSGPEGETTELRPTFSFSANEAATFACALDAAPAVPCAATFQPAADLAPGSHTFTVTATDTAGNADPVGAQRTFRVLESHEPPKEEHPKEESPKGEVPPLATKLTLRGSLSRHVLRVRVSLNPGGTGSVTVTITSHIRHRKLKRHLSVTLNNGAGSARLLLPRAVTRVTLTARYEGDATHAATTATKSLRTRRR